MWFSKKNIKREFKNTGILFWDLDFIILKLNVYFCILIIFSFHKQMYL